MALNRWRYVEYSDDGCSYYQCLMCKGTYEGRTEPGWWEHDTGIYHPVFVYCPFCGTKWEGGLKTEYGNSRGLGARRLRIWNALQEYWEKRVKVRPKTCWVLEEFCEYNQEIWFRKSEWSVVNCFDPLRVSAVDMLKNLKRSRQEESDWPDRDCRKQYRVRIVPTPVDARL